MAYDVGPGHAIFTTPFTFAATAGGICLLGAAPVFVDVDNRTFNMDPAKFNNAVTALKNHGYVHPFTAESQPGREARSKSIKERTPIHGH